jgi:hypothetical protein
MAKLEGVQQPLQSALCSEEGSYTAGDGRIIETYKMRLDGNERLEFELVGSKYFKAEKGKWYYPVLDVIPVARISKRTNQPYNKYEVVVRWHERV